MLVEMRTYAFAPGRMPRYLALLESDGLPLMKRHLGTSLGHYTTEVGSLNRMIQLWAYRDAQDREERRARLMAEPAWQRFLEAALPLIERQENRLLRPTSFSVAPALESPSGKA